MAGVQAVGRPNTGSSSASPNPPNIHGLMVSVDTRHAGEPGFDSLLRHFFKNLNQHLALQGLHAGQTVLHPPLYNPNQWLNHLKTGGQSVTVAK